ncbi:hypothetical protein [Streptomyces daghestanicus]|nr:hypothetical protein [Streptomyces daghestanicus]
MAHAETTTDPTPSRTGQGRTTPSTPDVFGPRTHLVAKWLVPVLLALVFGWWAAANRRHGTGITGGNMLFGWLSALVFLILYVAVREIAVRLRREQHALLWAAFTGSAVGFLIYQSGRSLIQSAGIGLAVAAGMFLMAFYRYYTQEDATGRRLT